jgi:hypothetical protein
MTITNSWAIYTVRTLGPTCYSFLSSNSIFIPVDSKACSKAFGYSYRNCSSERNVYLIPLFSSQYSRGNSSPKRHLHFISIVSSHYSCGDRSTERHLHFIPLFSSQYSRGNSSPKRHLHFVSIVSSHYSWGDSSTERHLHFIPLFHLQLVYLRSLICFPGELMFLFCLNALPI